MVQGSVQLNATQLFENMHKAIGQVNRGITDQKVEAGLTATLLGLKLGAESYKVATQVVLEVVESVDAEDIPKVAPIVAAFLRSVPAKVLRVLTEEVVLAAAKIDGADMKSPDTVKAAVAKAKETMDEMASKLTDKYTSQFEALEESLENDEDADSEPSAKAGNASLN